MELNKEDKFFRNINKKCLDNVEIKKYFTLEKKNNKLFNTSQNLNLFLTEKYKKEKEYNIITDKKVLNSTQIQKQWIFLKK